jgi:ubiquinone/menaquinone biosynthesis C-methylase UbiE
VYRLRHDRAISAPQRGRHIFVGDLLFRPCNARSPFLVEDTRRLCGVRQRYSPARSVERAGTKPAAYLFDDLPEIHRRRERNGFQEVLSEKAQGRRPDYYLQNFHFKSGGWMTDDSAERYDTQVEVLFKGTANAMRRQALPQLFEVFTGHDQRALRLIDLGCGTGRFLDLVKQAWPRLPSLGLDLSEAYVQHARRYLRRWSRLDLVVANAEAIPAPDNSVDAVTSICMVHELPPKVRRIVIRECERVLKPGGRLILLDSLQSGDKPANDGLLERFPKSYHEPYYRSYVDEDFPAIGRRCGLTHRRNVTTFVSKVMVFDKPAN